MLEAFKSSRLFSRVNLAVWSPKMDVLAVLYDDSLDHVEFRRMDWTKVNSISIKNDSVNHLCFSPNGRMICLSTLNRKLLIYNVEDTVLLSSNTFQSGITAIAVGSFGSGNIFAISFDDGSISIFFGFHLALCHFQLEQSAKEMSFFENELYILLEDMKTVQRYSLPFLDNSSSILYIVSETISSFWILQQRIENSLDKVNENWNMLKNDIKPILKHLPSITNSILLHGITPSDLSTEQLPKIKKIVFHSLNEIVVLYTDVIIPSFLEIGECKSKLNAAEEFSSNDLGLKLTNLSSNSYLPKCFDILDQLHLFKECFESLFEFLSGADLITTMDKYHLQPHMMVNFIKNLDFSFDLTFSDLESKPISTPIHIPQEHSSTLIDGRFSTLNGQFLCSLSNKTVVTYDLHREEQKEYPFEDFVVYSYPFPDGCVGCFIQDEEQVRFIMMGSDDESFNGLPISDVSSFIVSNRRIALVVSPENFFSVVDLESVQE